MKIAFINIYQELVERGAEVFVKEMSERLSKRHSVDVISGKSLPGARWPFLWRAFLDPQGITIALFTLKNLMKIWREKYDVVIPLNGGWQPAFVRIVTWLYGGKMIIAGQSGIGWDDRNNLWCFPDCFVALTSKAKKWALGANPFTKKVVYIPNGVDLTKFKPEGKILETKLKRPIMLCVGALTQQKRIDLTIRAVAKLKNVSLLVVGDGDKKEELIKLGKELLSDRFEHKSVSYNKMPEVYRSADVFTLVPESSEAFGNVYVEAMATNLPVVATDDEQRREIVGNAGIFVDPRNIEGYVKSLREALTKNWKNIPRRQAEKFDWDKITQKYEELFERLASNK